MCIRARSGSAEAEEAGRRLIRRTGGTARTRTIKNSKRPSPRHPQWSGAGGRTAVWLQARRRRTQKSEPRSLRRRTGTHGSVCAFFFLFRASTARNETNEKPPLPSDSIADGFGILGSCTSGARGRSEPRGSEREIVGVLRSCGFPSSHPDHAVSFKRRWLDKTLRCALSLSLPRLCVVPRCSLCFEGGSEPREEAVQQRVSVDAFLYLRLFIRVSRCTMLPFRELKRRFSFPPACLVRVRFGGLNRKVCLNGMENGCVMGITLSASLNMEIHYYHLHPPSFLSRSLPLLGRAYIVPALV